MKSVTVLVVNAGSSSVKLGVFVVGGKEKTEILTATADGLGQAKASLTVKRPNGEGGEFPIVSDYTQAVEDIAHWLVEQPEAEGVQAVGHRLVYGGTQFNRPTELNDEVVTGLQQLAADDPEHMPQALHAVAVMRRAFTQAGHYGSFDTAFFAELPAVAQIVPIPKQYRDAGVRRYGFHGLSYTYLRQKFEEIAGEEAMRGRVIYAHLGSGASLCATLDGHPIDMTMGFTPASGVVMSSRTGDLDPGLGYFLQRKFDMTPEQFQQMVTHESGLKAVSEKTADMYQLITTEREDPKAALAIELFCYRIRQAIGSLSASMGGLDSLVFAGGIGEKSDPLRARICQGLAYLGVQIDEERNARHDELISFPGKGVGVHRIPTNEAETIVNETLALYSNR